MPAQAGPQGLRRSIALYCNHWTSHEFVSRTNHLLLRKIIKRTLAFAVFLLCVLYAGDYLSVRFRIPSNREPLGTVNVQTTYAVKQKDGKTEFYFNPPRNQTCVNSIFPHLGYTPCWYLRRNRKQQISM